MWSIYKDSVRKNLDDAMEHFVGHMHGLDMKKLSYKKIRSLQKETIAFIAWCNMKRLQHKSKSYERDSSYEELMSMVLATYVDSSLCLSKIMSTRRRLTESSTILLKVSLLLLGNTCRYLDVILHLKCMDESHLDILRPLCRQCLTQKLTSDPETFTKHLLLIQRLTSLWPKELSSELLEASVLLPPNNYLNWLERVDWKSMHAMNIQQQQTGKQIKDQLTNHVDVLESILQKICKKVTVLSPPDEFTNNSDSEDISHLSDDDDDDLNKSCCVNDSSSSSDVSFWGSTTVEAPSNPITIENSEEDEVVAMETESNDGKIVEDDNDVNMGIEEVGDDDDDKDGESQTEKKISEIDLTCNITNSENDESECDENHDTNEFDVIIDDDNASVDDKIIEASDETTIPQLDYKISLKRKHDSDDDDVIELEDEPHQNKKSKFSPPIDISQDSNNVENMSSDGGVVRPTTEFVVVDASIESDEVNNKEVDEAAEVNNKEVDEAAEVNNKEVDEAAEVNNKEVDEAAKVNIQEVDEAAKVNIHEVDEAAEVNNKEVDELHPIKTSEDMDGAIVETNREGCVEEGMEINEVVALEQSSPIEKKQEEDVVLSIDDSITKFSQNESSLPDVTLQVTSPAATSPGYSAIKTKEIESSPKKKDDLFKEDMCKLLSNKDENVVLRCNVSKMLSDSDVMETKDPQESANEETSEDDSLILLIDEDDDKEGETAEDDSKSLKKKSDDSNLVPQNFSPNVKLPSPRISAIGATSPDVNSSPISKSRDDQSSCLPETPDFSPNLGFPDHHHDTLEEFKDASLSEKSSGSLLTSDASLVISTEEKGDEVVNKYSLRKGKAPCNSSFSEASHVLSGPKTRLRKPSTKPFKSSTKDKKSENICSQEEMKASTHTNVCFVTLPDVSNMEIITSEKTAQVDLSSQSSGKSTRSRRSDQSNQSKEKSKIPRWVRKNDEESSQASSGDVAPALRRSARIRGKN